MFIDDIGRPVNLSDAAGDLAHGDAPAAGDVTLSPFVEGLG
jgi:hypothetical protein